MDFGRVDVCHKLENKRRKFLMVINDVVKNKYEVYAEYIKNSHVAAEHNFEKSRMYVRRALVRQKVLQKCMKMRCNLDCRNAFGRYGGKTIESFGRDIEIFIDYNHPKMRQKRYLQKLLNESLAQGAILNENTVKDRVAGWIERSYTKYKLMKAIREKSMLKPIQEMGEKLDLKIIPKLPVLSNPFYSGAQDKETNTNPETDSDVPKLTEEMSKVEISTNTNHHHPEIVDDTKTISRRTLVLPPIKTTRALIAAT